MTIKSDSTVAIIQLAQLGPRGVVFSTLWIKNLTEITLSVTVFKINIIFHFCQNSRRQQKSEKYKFFRGAIAVVLSTLGVKNLVKTVLSLMVFEINYIFHVLE